VSRYFHAAGSKLKHITTRRARISPAEASIRKNTQRGLATVLHDLSLVFRKAQKDYVGKLASRKEGGMGLGGGSATEGAGCVCGVG
jgi:hypothetical protein